MSGSSLGKILKITTWGESHGPSLGVVIDGVPSGISLSCEDFIEDMKRRKPSEKSTSTKRKENDEVNILSGVFEGKTTGTPISLLIENTDQHSTDYSEIKDVYRPGHADFTYESKYGFRDYRGGGRSSGRETASRVAAGVVAKKIISELGVTLESSFVYREDIPSGDSAGGKVITTIKNVPVGLGEPVFDKLDALLSHAIMSIGAIKAIEFGDGIKVCEMLGSENNDEFINNGEKVITKTNHCGGILGGISNGQDIVITSYVKPTPSISLKQNTVDKEGNNTTINIKGRHDVSIVPRVVPVIEAMCSIVIADELLCNLSSKIENVKTFYKGDK